MHKLTEVARLSLKNIFSRMLLPMCSPAVETYEKNADAWAHGRLLQVGKAHFLVDRNPPLVEKVILNHRQLSCVLWALQQTAFLL